MIKKTQKKSFLLKIVFWISIGIFVVMLSLFLIPNNRVVFPFIATLAITFFLLGILLIILTIKKKEKGKNKFFLIFTGISSVSILVSVILHNLFYGLGIITEHIVFLHYIMEFLHVVFFFIAIPISPICFIIGAIGTIVLLIKEKNK